MLWRNILPMLLGSPWRDHRPSIRLLTFPISRLRISFAPYSATPKVLDTLVAKVGVWIWQRIFSACLAAQVRIDSCVFDSPPQAKEREISREDAVNLAREHAPRTGKGCFAPGAG